MKILNSKAYLLVLFFNISFSITAQDSKFKIVLDAGHGGEDPGNVNHGFVEKTISLKTALKVGKLLSKYNDIGVTYTRDGDTSLTLKERAILANRIDAHLFISIHCNAAKAFTAFGTETFVMGMSRTDTNLDVAKRENSVILQEDGYKENYKGFDPNNPETLIGLKILQEEYLNQSIDLASKIEANFKNVLNKKSRGVKQQPLWVLDATYMPSILIEIGFLSNKREGSFLNTDGGQEKIAKAIFSAIIEYKKEFFATSKTVNIEETNNTSNESIIFKVQISASSRNLDLKPNNFKGLKNIYKEKSATIYKYFYEEASTYEEANKNLKHAKEKGYKSAFIVAYKNGEKINITEAIK